jgi:hypothetical protein
VKVSSGESPLYLDSWLKPWQENVHEERSCARIATYLRCRQPNLHAPTPVRRINHRGYL